MEKDKIIDFYKSSNQSKEHYFNFSKHFPKSFENPAKFSKDMDQINDYYLNSNWFRTKEFDSNKKIDILTAGCSNTFGAGVPEKGTWSSLLADNKYNYINLGENGSGVEKIVHNILKYINLYGNPKNIVCLFPDPYRLMFTNDPDFHIFENLKNENVYFLSGHLNTVDRSKDDFIKPKKIIQNPFLIESNISPHHTINDYLKNIYILQTVCEKANINFIWSTWNDFINEILEILFKMENFFLNKNNYIFQNKKNSIILYSGRRWFCDFDHNHILENDLCWDEGVDMNKHPGIHWHHHVSELFKEHLIL
jgi:hypothetical protein